MLAIQLRHSLVLLLLAQFLVTGALLFLARVLRDPELVEIVLLGVVYIVFTKNQRVICALEPYLLAAGEDLVPPALVVPLGERGGHVHLLDDVAPADAGVVRAEGNFAFLGRVGDNALLSAPEIVVEQILKPHTGDEQEVPAILAPLRDIGHGAVTRNLAVSAGLRLL